MSVVLITFDQTSERETIVNENLKGYYIFYKTFPIFTMKKGYKHLKKNPVDRFSK